MTSDPFTLRGEPMSIMASGVQWLSFATRADEAAAELRAAAQASAAFLGDEGEMFRLRIEQDTAAGVTIAAQAWRIVGDALIRYAAQLDAGQVQLRSLAATAADQRPQVEALRSVAMSGAPARAAERQDDLRVTSGRAAAVRAEHDVCPDLRAGHPPAPRSRASVSVLTLPHRRRWVVARRARTTSNDDCSSTAWPTRVIPMRPVPARASPPQR